MRNPTASLEQRASEPSKRALSPVQPTSDWLREYGKDAPIAIFTLIALVCHLALRYVWKAGSPVQELPLYAALLAGGIPLIVGLIRQAIKLEFGSDWLAGISIVT